MSRGRPRGCYPAMLVAAVLATSTAAGAHDRAAGRVDDHRGEPVAGATVTVVDSARGHAVTVYTDALGRFRLPALRSARYDLRVAHPDHATLRLDDRRITARTALPLRVALAPDAETHAGALAANRWLALLGDPARRELLQRCTGCHQLGDPATRRPRSETEWVKLVALMARMGAALTPTLRDALPGAMATLGAPEAARQVLAQQPAGPALDPGAVVTTWALDAPGAMLRDLAVHPDGHVYAVDVAGDTLYRLDPGRGVVERFTVPPDDLPLGGRFAGPGLRLPASVTARSGPSSLVVAPDGALWIALALGNALARFEPGTRTWTRYRVPGRFPARLRVDLHGRLWYALALSNQLGLLDPTTGRPEALQLPARTWLQAVTTALAPGTDLHAARAALPAPPIGADVDQPVPTGLDVAPDGGLWFTQENAGRIGRVDAITRATERFDTPFPAPRHLRCDAAGRPWISDAGSGRLAHFDPVTERFATWTLPIAPAGSDTASALAVGPPGDAVWIGGATSDTLMRLDQDGTRFTTFPLPRGTVVRALAVTPTGAVWGVTGSAPTWHGAGAAFLRLEPAPPAR